MRKTRFLLTLATIVFGTIIALLIDNVLAQEDASDRAVQMVLLFCPFLVSLTFTVFSFVGFQESESGAIIISQKSLRWRAMEVLSDCLFFEEPGKKLSLCGAYWRAQLLLLAMSFVVGMVLWLGYLVIVALFTKGLLYLVVQIAKLLGLGALVGAGIVAVIAGIAWISKKLKLGADSFVLQVILVPSAFSVLLFLVFVIENTVAASAQWAITFGALFAVAILISRGIEAAIKDRKRSDSPGSAYCPRIQLRD
jgi:hypothetical protein